MRAIALAILTGALLIMPEPKDEKDSLIIGAMQLFGMIGVIVCVIGGW
jgi:hypothetical protein